MVAGQHSHVASMAEYDCGAVVDSGSPLASLCSGPNDDFIAHVNG